eukprot:scaffold13224_cov63-Phaeocystis_antarctica.AAC.1
MSRLDGALNGTSGPAQPSTASRLAPPSVVAKQQRQLVEPPRARHEEVCAEERAERLGYERGGFGLLHPPPLPKALDVRQEEAAPERVDSEGHWPRHLRRKQGGLDLGQLALRRLLSAPEHASGCHELRPAWANQPLGPRLPATSGFVPTCHDATLLTRLATNQSPKP